MAAATEVRGVDLAMWPPGTKLYATDENRWFVVIVDANEGSDYFVVRKQPTMIVWTYFDGRADNLDAAFTSAPGTSHEDAITEAGFTLGA